MHGLMREGWSIRPVLYSTHHRDPNSLSKEFPRKDEFETTAQFENRLARISGGKPCCFKMETSDPYHGIIKPYDADKGVIVIELASDYTDPLRFDPGPGKRSSLRMRQTELKRKSYVGENSFGVKRRITRIEERVYALAVDEMYFNPDKDYHEYRFELALSPTEAKELKNNLGILIFCKARHYGGDTAFTLNKNDYVAATINFPTEISTDIRYISVGILQVWLYNVKTGHVLSKNVF